MNLLIRISVFLIASALGVGVSILLGQVVKYDLLQLGGSDIIRPAMAFELVVSVLLVRALFRKIIVKRPVLGLVVGLCFYLSCHAVSGVFVAFDEVDLAVPFEWLAIVGLIVGLTVAKLKKSDPA
jgi:hypothetical protein